jgi:hypothetical protein
MYAKLTKDCLWREDDSIPSRVGTTWGEKEKADGPILKFRCLDDDGEVYYYGEGDDDSLDTVYEWTMRDAGCTSLEVRDEHGNWKAEIA